MDSKRRIDEQREQIALAELPRHVGNIDWDDAEFLDVGSRDLRSSPTNIEADQGPFFGPVPEDANSDREVRGIRNQFSDWLYYNSTMPLEVHKELGVFRKPGESDREFNARLQQTAREHRDDEVDALEAKFEKKIDVIEERKRKEERELAGDKADHAARKQAEFVGIGETVLGMFMGRRSSRSFSAAASKRRMTSKAYMDIAESEAQIAEYDEDIQELNADLQEAIDDITARWDNVLDGVTVKDLKPRRTDVDVEMMALAWRPSWLIEYDDGHRRRTATIPAYRTADEE